MWGDNSRGLPKGGGAIRVTGEEFPANPVTGPRFDDGTHLRVAEPIRRSVGDLFRESPQALVK